MRLYYWNLFSVCLILLMTIDVSNEPGHRSREVPAGPNIVVALRDILVQSGRRAPTSYLILHGNK